MTKRITVPTDEITINLDKLDETGKLYGIFNNRLCVINLAAGIYSLIFAYILTTGTEKTDKNFESVNKLRSESWRNLIKESSKFGVTWYEA